MIHFRSAIVRLPCASLPPLPSSLSTPLSYQKMTAEGSEKTGLDSAPVPQNGTSASDNGNSDINMREEGILPSPPSPPHAQPIQESASIARMIAGQPQLARVRSRTGVEDQLEMFSWSEKTDPENGSVNSSSRSVNSRSNLWSSSKEKSVERDDVESQISAAGSSAENSPVEEVRACVPGK